jgi:hypothetical protein
MSARVYAFGFTQEEESRINALFAEMGIPEIVRIGKQQGSVTLRDIIEQGRIGDSETELDERIVLFHEVSEKGVYALMQSIKSIEVPKPIFAVVTEHSIEWTFEELAHHLLQEKKAFEEGRPDSSGA